MPPAIDLSVPLSSSFRPSILYPLSVARGVGVGGSSD